MPSLLLATEAREHFTVSGSALRLASVDETCSLGAVIGNLNIFQNKNPCWYTLGASSLYPNVFRALSVTKGITNPSVLHMPHLYGSLEGNVKRVLDTLHFGFFQRVDPWMTSTRRGHVFWGNVVAQIPIPCMVLTLSTLWWQANCAENTNGEEATAVITPEVFRQMVSQRLWSCNCLPGHGRWLIVHDKVDEAPKQIGSMAPRPGHSEGFGDVTLDFSTSSALFWLQCSQVKICLAPHVMVELLQGGNFAHQMRWPKCFEDVVSDIPDLLSVNCEGSCPVLACHGWSNLPRKQQEGGLQRLNGPFSGHASPLHGCAGTPRAVPPWPTVAHVSRASLHTRRRQHIKARTCAHQVWPTSQWPFHSPTLGVRFSRLLCPSHKSIGKWSICG